MPDPVNPDAIAALPGVKHSFQADRDFQPIQTSSDRALELLETSRATLRIASDMAEKTGLGMVFRMQVTSTDGDFMLFSLNPQVEPLPGPRVFGIETDSSTQIDEVATSLTQLL